MSRERKAVQASPATIEQQLNIAFGAITIAHRILGDINRQLAHQQIAITGPAPCAVRRQYGRRKLLQPRQAESLLERFKQGLFQDGNDVPSNWKDLLLERIQARVERAGQAGAAVLVRLMEEPGKFIRQEELMSAAGINAQSSHVVKVYVCYLRQAFERHGYSASLIETGRKSYALQADALPDVIEMLTRA